jgi:hypothetical protein
LPCYLFQTARERAVVSTLAELKMAFFTILLHPLIDSERGIFGRHKEIFICKDD